MDFNNEYYTAIFGVGLIKDKKAIEKAIKKHFPSFPYIFVPLYTKGKQPHYDKMMEDIWKNIKLRKNKETQQYVKYGYFTIVTPNLNSLAEISGTGNMEQLFMFYNAGHVSFGLMAGNKMAIIDNWNERSNREQDESNQFMSQ